MGATRAKHDVASNAPLFFGHDKGPASRDTKRCVGCVPEVFSYAIGAFTARYSQAFPGGGGFGFACDRRGYTV